MGVDGVDARTETASEYAKVLKQKPHRLDSEKLQRWFWSIGNGDDSPHR